MGTYLVPVSPQWSPGPGGAHWTPFSWAETHCPHRSTGALHPGVAFTGMASWPSLTLSIVTRVGPASLQPGGRGHVRLSKWKNHLGNRKEACARVCGVAGLSRAGVRARPPAPRPGAPCRDTSQDTPNAGSSQRDSWKQFPPLPRVVVGQSLKVSSTGSSETSCANNLPNVPPKTTRALSKGHLRLAALRGSEFTEGRQQNPRPALPALCGHWPVLSPHTHSSTWHLLGAGREEPAPPGVWAASHGQ